MKNARLRVRVHDLTGYGIRGEEEIIPFGHAVHIDVRRVEKGMAPQVTRLSLFHFLNGVYYLRFFWGMEFYWRDMGVLQLSRNAEYPIVVDGHELQPLYPWDSGYILVYAFRLGVSFDFVDQDNQRISSPLDPE